MGNPTILRKEQVDVLWRCTQCCNQKEFNEEWSVEINQNLVDMSQEYNLILSENIKCKLCGSKDIEEFK